METFTAKRRLECLPGRNYRPVFLETIEYNEVMNLSRQVGV